MRENIQHFRKIFSNYSLATRLCDEDHSVQIALMMSVIGDEASRIIYRLMDEPERTMMNEVLCVLEQKLTSEFNIQYERYLFNLIQQETEETYQEYFMRLMTQEDDQTVLKIEKRQGQGVFATLKIIRRDSGVVDVCFPLDTGASCNIVGLKTLQRIVGIKSLNLSESRAVLRPFSVSQIRIQTICSRLGV
ncbi:hypothetical protein J6590_021277 [Homalodisca vitripennis]|nr:hypothetical protein J6590_021277 [Homalodisca vitripennis]